MPKKFPTAASRPELRDSPTVTYLLLAQHQSVNEAGRTDIDYPQEIELTLDEYDYLKRELARHREKAA